MISRFSSPRRGSASTVSHRLSGYDPRIARAVRSAVSAAAPALIEMLEGRVLLSVTSTTPVPFTAIEGNSFSGAVASFTANDAGPFTATVNWGDATTSAGVVTPVGGGFDVRGTHTYPEDGPYAASVTITDTRDATTSSGPAGPATITEALLSQTSIPINAIEGALFSGSTATFDDPGSPDTGSAFSSTLDWGDGTSSAGTVSGAAGSYTISGTHTYAEDGNFTVTTTTDEQNQPAFSVSSSAGATITEVLLSQTSIPINATEGTLFSGNVAFFGDPGSPDAGSAFSSTLNWGDGTTSAGTVSGAAGSYTISGTHTYADEGNFTVTTTTAENNQPAFSVSSGTNATVAEGDVLTPDATQPTIPTSEETFSGPVAVFDHSGFTANPSTDFTATINWGDGSPVVPGNGTITSGPGNTFVVSGTHTYTTGGSFTITTTIADDAPGTATATATNNVFVAELDLVAKGISPGIITSTESFGTGSVTVSTFTDPGGDPASNYSADIDWGDGSAHSAGSISFDAGSQTYTVTGSHNYAEEGLFKVTSTITEISVPGTFTATSPALVADAPLSSTPVAPAAVEGTPFTNAVVANFTDADLNGTIGDYIANIDWGDGSAGSVGVIQSDGAGGFNVVASHTYAEEGTFSLVVSIHDAGSATFVIDNTVVADAAVVPTGGPPITGVESQTTANVVLATFTDPGGPEPLADYSAAVDWGDGTPVDPSAVITFDASSNVFTVTGSHTYDEESAPEHPGSQPYAITVTISHDTAPDAIATTTATIAELPVIGTALPNASSATVGVSTGPVALAKFIDPGDAEDPLADYSATVNYHDGSAAETGAITYDGMTGFFTVTASHTYNSAGTFAAPTVTIVHETTTTVVQDKNPVTVGSPLSGSGATINGIEGRPLTAVKVASFTAGNSASASGFTATINWGDGATTAGTIVKDSNGHFHVNGTHTYQEQIPAGATLTIKITPTVGSSITVFGLAKIPDGLLLSGVGTNFSVKKGVTFSSHLLGSFTDQDAFNTLPSYIGGGTKISWGDGTTTTMTNANFKRTGANSAIGTFWQVLGTHAYSSVGTKMVTLTIKDNGGAPPITITLKITVTN